MAYHHFDPDDLPATPDFHCDRRSVSEAADLAALHLAVYALDPGDPLAGSYHYHERREEALYVVEGSLHVETPEREYVIDAGEVFVATPESPHRAFNPADADEPVRVLGTGAPKTDVGRPYEPVEDESDVTDAGGDA